ncbi:MAG TPA: hypothetical protein VM939_00830 [Gemmatimonadaceae bacterium]|nr:hypothetical protein [Gemmatimonadaceae bacterium]
MVTHINAFRLAVVITATAVASGCTNPFSGACIYEIRSVEVSGSVTLPTTTEPIFAEMNLGERRDNDPDKFIYWRVSSTSLKGRVTSAVLKDARALTIPLYTFPLLGVERPPIVEGSVNQQMGANLNGFYDILAGGNGLIELRTDLPDRTLISIPLLVKSKQDWTRPNCS